MCVGSIPAILDITFLKRKPNYKPKPDKVFLKQNQASHKIPKLKRRVAQPSSFTFYTEPRFKSTFGSKRFIRKSKS